MPPVKTLSIREFERLRAAQPNVTVCQVLDHPGYHADCRIPGARHCPISQILDGHVSQFHPDTPVVVY